MKFNLKAVSFGAIATLSLLAVPLAMTHSAHAEGGRRGHHLEQLDLSEAQTADIEAIREGTRSQMQSVLTAEQRTQLENSENQGRRAFRQLDLSESQREQLRSIREASREEIKGVLTAEQQAQLEEMHEQRGRRGGRREGGRQAGGNQ
ncbi:MAG: Spy/CpxP family protein refolding chaperone [Cyanobacteria bacterium J06598_1]